MIDFMNIGVEKDNPPSDTPLLPDKEMNKPKWKNLQRFTQIDFTCSCQAVWSTSQQSYAGLTSVIRKEI